MELSLTIREEKEVELKQKNANSQNYMVSKNVEKT